MNDDYYMKLYPSPIPHGGYNKRKIDYEFILKCIINDYNNCMLIIDKICEEIKK